MDTCLPALPVGTSAERGAVATTPAQNVLSGLKAPKSAPPDLLSFVQAHRPTEAAKALGLSRRTVHRVSQGYWPKDPRAVLAAWAAYTGQTAARKSRWFMRRVHPGGLVRHSPLVYTGHGLDVRVGQLVAVARAEGGGLVAQTLELPITRLTLWVSVAQPEEQAS